MVDTGRLNWHVPYGGVPSWFAESRWPPATMCIVRSTMTTAPTNKRTQVVASAALGFCAGWVFVPLTMNLLYYTTKPMDLIEGETIWVFAVLFGASFSAIPFFASRGGDPSRRPRLRVLLVLGLIWSTSIAVAFLIVRTVTAHIHNTTLDIPEQLIPGGLFFIPVFAGLVVFLAAIWTRRRNRPSL
jgi:glucan phosphoethanolaminetransferase (alkaline phosphatase superfamily)